MRDFLKQYRISLELIGPVHIGSGKSLRKSQWIINREKNEAVILDSRKLMELLEKRNLLDRFVEYNFQAKSIPLGLWLRENNVSNRDILSIAAYTLDIKGVNLKSVIDMNLTMKDAYGNPYIPGTSLKGAVRTAILAKKVRDGRFDEREIISEIQQYHGKNPKAFLRREAMGLQTEMLHTKEFDGRNRNNAVNDCMSGIRISDSNAAALSDLTLCQKIDIRKDGSDSELPLVRECIKPGTKFDFLLTIDATETDIDAAYIKEAINEFLKDYNQLFLGEFEEEELYRDNVIYLGGGVGFPSKTVLNQVLRKRENRVDLVARTIDNVLPMKMKRHSKDKFKGVSPSVVKLTEVNGMLTQMGSCRVEIISI